MPKYLILLLLPLLHHLPVPACCRSGILLSVPQSRNYSGRRSISRGRKLFQRALRSDRSRGKRRNLQDTRRSLAQQRRTPHSSISFQSCGYRYRADADVLERAQSHYLGGIAILRAAMPRYSLYQSPLLR